MNHRFAVPIIATIVVVVLPATLIGVALRSPYTHANLVSRFDSGYTRTEQAEVGPPRLYRPASLSIQVDATAPMEERGKALYVAYGCAGCHGVNGEGGAVGPRPIPDLEVLRENVRRGPGGMPVFAERDVSDYDLTAITAYLKSMNK
ncbi:MAG: cytochrome c [Chloroflexi bacterium]|nr:cytochrome c [Chloroflexota bacterium]